MPPSVFIMIPTHPYSLGAIVIDVFLLLLFVCLFVFVFLLSLLSRYTQSEGYTYKRSVFTNHPHPPLVPRPIVPQLRLRVPPISIVVVVRGRI